MKADAIFISNSLNKLAIFENKIGSAFTYGAEADTGQLARQLQYLMKANFQKSYLILLSLREMYEANWYISELKDTITHWKPNKKIQSRLMLWDDVIEAFEANK